MTDPIRAAAERLLQHLDQHRSTNLYVPLFLDQAEVELRAALAAPTPEPDTDAVLGLAAIIREVGSINHRHGAAALAEAILSHPAVREVFAAPTPPADGEVGEKAGWLEDHAENCAELGRPDWAQCSRRAAALLRESRPQPGWQPISTAPKDGTEILASDYDTIEIVNWSWDAWETGSGWIDRDGRRLHPAWWQPLPEHPPIPTEPTTPTETND